MVKGDKNTIWIGLGDGTLQKTHNALSGSSSSWSAVTVTGAPARHAVTGIAIDPSITQTVVVVYPGFSFSADPPQHVYMTSPMADRGKTSPELLAGAITTCGICPSLPWSSSGLQRPTRSSWAAMPECCKPPTLEAAGRSSELDFPTSR
jgi:hypothetical protein